MIDGELPEGTKPHSSFRFAADGTDAALRCKQGVVVVECDTGSATDAAAALLLTQHCTVARVVVESLPQFAVMRGMAGLATGFAAMGLLAVAAKLVDRLNQFAVTAAKFGDWIDG